MAKQFLNGIEYEIIDAEEESALASQYGIMTAPALIALKDGVVQKYVGASLIKGFVEGLK